jgi:hypothetical protein
MHCIGALVHRARTETTAHAYKTTRGRNQVNATSIGSQAYYMTMLGRTKARLHRTLPPYMGGHYTTVNVLNTSSTHSLKERVNCCRTIAANRRQEEPTGQPTKPDQRPVFSDTQLPTLYPGTPPTPNNPYKILALRMLLPHRSHVQHVIW